MIYICIISVLTCVIAIIFLIISLENVVSGFFDNRHDTEDKYKFLKTGIICLLVSAFFGLQLYAFYLLIDLK